MNNPLVGRPVLYYPSHADGFCTQEGVALAGTLACQSEDGRWAVGVLDHKGQAQAVRGVRLYAHGDKLPPEGGRFAVLRGGDLHGQPPAIRPPKEQTEPERVDVRQVGEQLRAGGGEIATPEPEDPGPAGDQGEHSESVDSPPGQETEPKKGRHRR